MAALRLDYDPAKHSQYGSGPTGVPLYGRPAIGWASFGPSSGAIGETVVDPFKPGIVYLGPTDDAELNRAEIPYGNALFFQSVDGGQSWETWDKGDRWGLSFGADPGIMYRVEGILGLAKSTDYGKSWKLTGLESPGLVRTAVPDPYDPEIVWALGHARIHRARMEGRAGGG